MQLTVSFASKLKIDLECLHKDNPFLWKTDKPSQIYYRGYLQATLRGKATVKL